jgi:hypothetical protein
MKAVGYRKNDRTVCATFANDAGCRAITPQLSILRQKAVSVRLLRNRPELVILAGQNRQNLPVGVETSA